VLRSGASADYHTVEVIEGEPHLVRGPMGMPRTRTDPGPGRPLLCLAHVTDLQIADVQSPTRFEFLNRLFADPRYAQIVPVQRPQEALTMQAVDATVRTLNAVRGPATGLPPQFAVTTGDAIDNAQWNELQNFFALFDGGLVAPDSGGPGYEGVQGLDWPDDIFWKPDGIPAGGPDVFRREFGFPGHPGLLARALRDFRAGGLSIPWLSCFGNHEALNQGVGVLTEGITRALTGDRKPVGLADGFDHDEALELFTVRPEVFMTGPARAVTADPARRPITRQEFVEAHFRPGARPYGHGFCERNRRDGTAYYVYDTPAVRFIALDTNCLAGGAAGCLDHDQAAWLEDRLAEVHADYEAPDGAQVRTGNPDRLVVLFSHHGIDTLTNTRTGHAGPDTGPLLGAAEILAQLHRFGNIVLWLNGHTHLNAVRRRVHPGNPVRGFWEVTTCAVIDWPCQTRLVELVDHGSYLAIVCTMVDHDTPVAPAALETRDDLASLHRELAANMPFRGARSGAAGTSADRNVELRVSPPFPLASI
jgi:metallophosphoesterase (TIGR03767 family)